MHPILISLNMSVQHRDISLQIVKRLVSSSKRILSNPIGVRSTLISRPSVTWIPRTTQATNGPPTDVISKTWWVKGQTEIFIRCTLMWSCCSNYGQNTLYLHCWPRMQSFIWWAGHGQKKKFLVNFLQELHFTTAVKRTWGRRRSWEIVREGLKEVLEFLNDLSWYIQLVTHLIMQCFL